MDTKVNFKAEKKTYSTGKVIILQGSKDKGIYFLHKGAIEVKRYGPEKVTELKERELIEKSKRTAVLEAPSIFGLENLIGPDAHKSSYLVISECLVTKYVIQANDFIGFFKSNPPIALNILLTQQEQVVKNLSNLKKYKEYQGLIEKFNDNFTLLFLFLSSNKGDPLYSKYTKNGGVFPQKIDGTFLKGDYSAALQKSYREINSGGDNFNIKNVAFYKSLLKSQPSSFISLITKDINIFLYIFESLSTMMVQSNIEIEKFATQTEERLKYFFLDNSSPFNKLYSISSKFKNNNLAPSLPASIVSICRNIDLINKQLGGKEHIEVFHKYDDFIKGSEPLKTTSGGNSALGESSEGETGNDPDGKYKEMYKGSLQKILGYSTLAADVKDRILKNLKKMTTLKEEDSQSNDGRKLIKGLQTDYYDLYENLFLKTMKDANAPPAVKLFLYFSFIDEKLISEKQIEFIHQSLIFFTKPQNTIYKIIHLYDYLKLIYDKEEEPSLSELGEFRKLLTKPATKTEKALEDSPKGRLSFEITNMVSNAMRITSDNVRAFIPYLTSKNFKGVASNVLVTQKKMDTYIKKIVDIDYSVFFRDMTWKQPGRSELIKKEVTPYFILVPNSGLRIQMWQEMVYSVRNTRARFVIPILFNTDLEKNLIFSCAHFRWNLNKSIVSNWMDPIEGGLTGAYFDYEQSYKKMSELSNEAKEDIKKQIKSIKIDRNRFAADYSEWLVYESKGVPKINKVLRKILYRFIPFTKEIRENIAKLPVYAEMDRKFDVIRDREFKKIEAKYKRYIDTGGMPEDLQAYLEMMQK